MIHVLVVDDSAVVRQTMAAILASAGDISVESASDPLIAMARMERRRPDVIVLDLEMPRMSGLAFLKRTLARGFLPIIVCSSFAESGTRPAVAALSEGAVEVIPKPKIGVREFLSSSAERFIVAVRTASEIPKSERTPPPAFPPPVPRLRGGPSAFERPSTRVIAIGASTGGPQALQDVLSALPPDVPGVVVAQHMPQRFTRAFAERLDERCAVRVREAENDDRVTHGVVLLAPGDHQMELCGSVGEYRVRVVSDFEPLVHRPSVDLLFASVARVAGRRSTGVVMTGMGDDGARGLLEMRRVGAFTLAQDEESSVVFGMPGEAIRRGAAERVVPLSRIASVLVDWARQEEHRG